MTVESPGRARRTGLAALCLAITPAAAAAERQERDGPDWRRALEEGRSGGLHPYAIVSLGRGLRLNNPYRLETPLGGDARSLSLTQTYVDLAAAVAFGSPGELGHGPRVDLSVATHGVPQEVVTGSYAVLLARGPWLGTARLGVPLVLEPDWTLGGEAAVGGARRVTGGLGVALELVGSVFWGAATRTRAVTTIPLVSMELGLWFDLEVLP